jgi:hypothetical protein
MRALGRLWMALVVAATAAAAGCSYAPNIESGTLTCGTGAVCPDGYRCIQSSNTCWKNGESPDGGGMTSDGGGPPITPFLGHWLFASTAVRTVQCTDTNIPMPNSLMGDFLDMTAGSGGAALSTLYYCTWQLDIGGSGTSTTIRANQSCSGTDMASGTMYTWHGMKFQFSLGNASSGATPTTATLDASLPADFKKTDNTTGTCTVTLTGSLTKG